mgnify:CR=1 FL=1
MKAVYCYDGPLYRDEEGFYYGRNFNDQMFERYFKVVDSLEIIIRVREMKQEDAIRSLSRIKNPNISVTECPNLSSVKGLLTKTLEVYKLLKERISKADVVFVRVPSNISNIAIDVCKKLDKKYLIEVVGCQWDAYWNYSLKGKLFALPATLMMKQRIKKAPYVLYVTNKFLQKRYPTNGKTINCSNVELAEMTNVVLDNRINRIKEYDTTTKYIIGTAAGIDVLFKGQEYIIRAIGALKEKGITCFEYWLVGGGTASRLMKIAEECHVTEQVKIMGQIPQSKIYDWLDEIDIYAQPSRQEGLPRAVIEAMSRGVPCIGAKTAGIPELLEEDYVFSNSKTEVEEICNILMRMINDKTKLQDSSKRNYEEAKKYQRNTLIEKRTAFFKEFVDENI